MSVLKQSKPVAATNDSYVATDTAQGLVKCCNQSSAGEKVRIAIIPAGEALVDGDKHYTVYDAVVPAGGQLSEPFEIDANDTITVYSAGGNISFTISGLLGV